MIHTHFICDDRAAAIYTGDQPAECCECSGHNCPAEKVEWPKATESCPHKKTVLSIKPAEKPTFFHVNDVEEVCKDCGEILASEQEEK